MEEKISMTLAPKMPRYKSSVPREQVDTPTSTCKTVQAEILQEAHKSKFGKVVSGSITTSEFSDPLAPVGSLTLPAAEMVRNSPLRSKRCARGRRFLSLSIRGIYQTACGF